MEQLLCTIGFAGKTAEEFFGLLRNAGVKQLIDIRQNRAGQLSGFAKHPDLSFFLRAIESIEYAHAPLLAPPPELLKTYRKTKDFTEITRMGPAFCVIGCKATTRNFNRFALSPRR